MAHDGAGAPLDPILEPRSVAVIGASCRKGSIGRHILENLVNSDFQGPVYPVNPKAESVSGIPCYPWIGQVPEPVDLAVVAVPAEHVLGVAEACGQAGVAGLVVITAGFREIGGRGAQREADLTELLDEYGMRAVGPNCMGVLNTDPEVSLNATFSPAEVDPGGLAFVSQSGALGMAILDVASELGLGLSHFVSLGNRVDVSSNDLLAAWGEDDRVEAVLLYLEHFGNPRNFIEVARQVTPNKPVLAVKSGRSSAGARAARSHTGAMAEQDVLTDALLEQCGILRADTIEEMFGYARVFARAPEPPGNRVAILTNSGGPGIMATDALDAVGLTLAELADETDAQLSKVVAHEASVQNPVDLTAGGGPETYRSCLKILLDDPGVDNVIVIYTPPTFMSDEKVVEALLTPDHNGKPVVCCVLGRGHGNTAFHLLTEAGLPTFTFPEAAVRSLGGYVAWSARRERPVGKVPAFPDIEQQLAGELLAEALEAGAEWLSPDQAFGLLEAYGLPVASYRMVRDPGQAADALDELGPPCVFKGQAEGLVHKTDVGAVVTEVATAQQARATFQQLRDRLEQEGYSFQGVLVQEQLPAGREVILGISGDPTFGPTVLFGLGGIHAEVLHDVVVRLAPLTDEEAARMVRAIRGWPLLEGVRGQSRADVGALEEMLLRLSTLAWAHPEIAELDVNPAIVGGEGEGATVVDARVRLWPDGQPPRAPGVIAELRGNGAATGS